MDFTSRSYRILTAAIPPLILFILIVLHNTSVLREPCTRNMDRAYTHLNVEAAARFEAFDGAFSHAGFRHPGPLFPYYLALSRAVSGEALPDKGTYHTATLLLNCVMLGAALYLSTLLIGGVFAPLSLFLITTAIIIGGHRTELIDYWNPYPIPAAALVYLLAAALFARGRAMMLPAIVATGSFISQCHVGTLPFLAVTFLYSAARYRRCEVPAGEFRKAAWLSIIIFAAAWLPVAADLFAHGADSNPVRIASGFLADHAGKGLIESARFVWGVPARDLRELLPVPRAYWFLLPCILLLALAMTRRRHGPLKELLNLLLLSWAVTLPAVTRSFQPLAPYLVTYLTSVTILLVFVAVVSALGYAGRWQRPAQFLVIGLLFLLALSKGVPRLSFAGCKQYGYADQFVGSLNSPPRTLHHVAVESRALRSFVVFFALRMVAHGQEVCFDDEWIHYVGRAFTCGYREPRSSATAHRYLVIGADGGLGATQGFRRGTKIDIIMSERSVPGASLRELFSFGGSGRDEDDETDS